MSKTGIETGPINELTDIDYMILDILNKNKKSDEEISLEKLDNNFDSDNNNKNNNNLNIITKQQPSILNMVNSPSIINKSRDTSSVNLINNRSSNDTNSIKTENNKDDNYNNNSYNLNDIFHNDEYEKLKIKKIKMDLLLIEKENYLKTLEILKLEKELGITKSRYSSEINQLNSSSSSNEYVYIK